MNHVIAYSIETKENIRQPFLYEIINLLKFYWSQTFQGKIAL